MYTPRHNAGSGGVYHSTYDSHAWMTRFGDPGFRYHAAAARVGAAMLLRLANAEVLPYDYVEFARTMRRYLPQVERGFQARGWPAGAAPLAAAIDRMEAAATRFAAARDLALERPLAAATRDATNAALLRVERALTRPEGLRTRPWYRNLIYVADENNGYSNMVFPSVNEAVRAGDQALAEREMADLTARFGQATAAIEAATVAVARTLTGTRESGHGTRDTSEAPSPVSRVPCPISRSTIHLRPPFRTKRTRP